MSDHHAAPSIQDRSSFERALHLGLGRVVLFLRENSDDPFRDPIQHACCHITAYDPQFEGTRAEYLHDVIRVTRNPSFYRDAVASALEQSGDDYDASLLFDLAGLFAADGDDDLRRRMYAKFDANAAHGDDLGATAIVDLDKASGLVHAADKVGTLLAAGHESRYYEYLLSVAEDAGVSVPLDVLRQAAPGRPGLSNYLAVVEATNARRAQSKTARRDPKSVALKEFLTWLESIETARPPVSPILWGQQASDGDLQQVADLLLNEDRPKHLRALLRIFKNRPYPLDSKHLIRLAGHIDKVVALSSLQALKQIVQPEVRTFALSLIYGSDNLAARAVGVLVKNNAPGDHALIEAMSERLQEPEAIHSFSFVATEYYEAHPEPDSETRIMLRLYEKNPCSFCREKTVERLLALGAFPEWMRLECAYDSNLEVRKMVGALA